MGVNVVILSGKIISKPEVRTTKDRGYKVTNFLLECMRQPKNRMKDVVSCVAWHDIAERCADIVRVGDEYVIHGTLVTNKRQIDDKELWQVQIEVNAIDRDLRIPKKYREDGSEDTNASNDVFQDSSDAE